VQLQLQSKKYQRDADRGNGQDLLRVHFDRVFFEATGLADPAPVKLNDWYGD